MRKGHISFGHCPNQHPADKVTHCWVLFRISNQIKLDLWQRSRHVCDVFWNHRWINETENGISATFLKNRNHQMQSMMGLAHGTIYWKLIEDMKRGLQPNSPFLWIIQQRFSFKQCIVFTKRDVCILNCFLKSPSLKSPTHVQLWSNTYITWLSFALIQSFDAIALCL